MAKIAGKDDLKLRGLKSAGIFERFLGSPANGTEVSGERKWKRCGGALDAGNGAQTLPDLADQHGALFRSIAAQRSADQLKRQQVVRIETGIESDEIAEAAHE